MSEQHDSKTEGRGTFACPICGQDTPHHHSDIVVAAWRKRHIHPAPTNPTEYEKGRQAGFEEAFRCVDEAVTSSPQSPSEPGRGDMLARQEHMAELEQEIAGLEASKGLANYDAIELRLISRRSELSRLRNEGGGESFQARVQPWMMACFGPEISKDLVERNHRFLEESLELVQALGCSRSEAHQLVDYTFDREPGNPDQEAGGVQVTHAALCLANGIDMHEAGERELARIWQKIDKIRAKQAAKPRHSPLPASPSHLPACEAIERSIKWRGRDMSPEEFAMELASDLGCRNKAAQECVLHYFKVFAAALQPLSQGNGAEPVAWRVRAIGPTGWKGSWFIVEKVDERLKNHEYVPLYAARSSQPEGVQEALVTTTICGSTRYPEQHISASGYLTLYEGRVVFLCSMLRVSGVTTEQAERFDLIHKEKIRRSDEILVLDDYVGNSTRSEIEFANSLGKKVRYLSSEPAMAEWVRSNTLSRGLVEAAEWQPIETAPLDRPVDLWANGRWPGCFYLDNRWVKNDRVIKGVPRRYIIENPTHWMPLPAPPRTADCQHEWVDARNEYVLSGEICLKCHAIRAAKPANAADREGDRDA